MGAFKSGFMGCFGVIAAGAVILIILAVIIGAAADKADDDGETSLVAPAGDSGATTATEETARAGGSLQVGDALVTAHGFRADRAGVVPPKAGFQYVVVDVSARNTGKDAYTLSSLLQTAMRDGEGRNYTPTLGARTSTSFDGPIPVGGIIRGEVAFEVPLNAAGLQFIFKQALGTKQAAWALQ